MCVRVCVCVGLCLFVKSIKRIVSVFVLIASVIVYL